MRLVCLALLLVPSVAFADDGDSAPSGPPKLALGLEGAFWKNLSTSGDYNGMKPTDQGTAYGATAYVEYRLARWLSLGVALPSTWNAPGPTSNEYDVAIAARVRFEVPVQAGLHPFLVVQPGLAFAHLPDGTWWGGHEATVQGGLLLDVTAKLALSVQGALLFESFDGDLMQMHGSFKNAFGGASAGVVFKF